MLVLVLTQQFDLTADYVVEELNRRGLQVARCDPGDFPLSLTVTGRLSGEGWMTELTHAGRVVRLEEVTAIYYRRPRNRKVIM